MKVKTIAQLNIRSSAGTNNPRTGILNPGVELEVEEVNGEKVKDTVNGKEIESSVWYKDASGHYYWGGGFPVNDLKEASDQLDLEISFQDFIAKNFDGKAIAKRIDYYKLLDGGSLDIEESLGEGIIVALMDTGIYHHPNIKESILTQEFDFTNSPFSFSDKKGHGTFLSGLICANSNSFNSISGIAPKCKIANFKVIKDNGTSVGEYLSAGLKKVSELYSNIIINMSLSISSLEYKILNDSKLFENLSEKFVLIAAAGENEQLLSKNGILSPANSTNIIAVGSIDESFFKTNKNPDFDSKLDFIIPQFDLVSCATGSGYARVPGVSSMACAVVSAIAALVLSRKATNYLSVENARKELLRIATPYKEIVDFNKLILIKP